MDRNGKGAGQFRILQPEVDPSLCNVHPSLLQMGIHNRVAAKSAFA